MASASRTFHNILRFLNNFAPFVYALGFVSTSIFGYWCLPGIINSVQGVIVWLSWFGWFFTYFLGASSLVFVFVWVIIAVLHWITKPAEENKPDLQDDEYLSTVSTTVRPSPREHGNYNNYRVTEVDDYNHNNNFGYNDYNNNYSSYMENSIAPVEESYDRLVVEEKRYRRTRWDKKKKEKMTVEYRRMEWERMTKTASRRSQAIDQKQVETFIMEKKRMFHSQTGAVDQWHTGRPHWQNGAFNQPWSNGVPECQNAIDHQWPNCVTVPYGAIDQCQNGALEWQNCGAPYGANDQWEYGVVPRWQENGSGRHGRHRSRSHKRLGGSCSGPDGSYLAISN